MLDALASRLEASWWRAHDPLSLVLAPLGWLYGLAWRAHALAFERGWLRRRHSDVPVLVIGNLVVGGAGKTPAVLATVRLLRERGYTPGIVSRGWGRSTDVVQEVDATSPPSLVGDEPLLLKLRSDAPVFVGRDRAAAVAALLRKHRRIDIVVSDDGAQHLALARDLTVLVFDDRGAGNGRLLPAGPLRQPMAARTPPSDCLVLYNALRPSTRWRGATARRRLAGVVEIGAWWRGDAPSLHALDALRGQRLIAAAGIAQPERFFTMLEDAGLVIERCPLPDHHDYETLPWRGTDLPAIVTEKDAVKLRPERVEATKVWVAALDFEPEAGYADALRRRLPPPRTAP
jgi:tetraacyldisaccharide 4'-kinase